MVGSRVEDGKLHSLSYEEINNIRKNYDFVLIGEMEQRKNY